MDTFGFISFSPSYAFCVGRAAIMLRREECGPRLTWQGQRYNTGLGDVRKVESRREYNDKEAT